MTEPDSTTSPAAPAPIPPGDFTNSSVWTSPSTYLTLSTYLLPLFTLIFKDNANAVVNAVVGIAPIVATLVLVIQRNQNHRNVQQLNAQLTVQRMAKEPEAMTVVEAEVLPSMEYAGAEIERLKAEMVELRGLLPKRRSS